MPGAGTGPWTRRTEWRQGSVLTRDAAERCGVLRAEDAADVRVVVIAHDCDVANDDLAKEPLVEVIVGRHVAQPDGSAAWGKSSRTLHYAVDCAGETEWIELRSTGKASIEKERLAQFKPDGRYSMPAEALDVLQRWLAVRHRLREGCGIVLNDCYAMSEDDITVSQERSLKLWDLDYVSAKAGGTRRNG